MKFELILPRELYLTGENISVDVRLTNTGQAAVDAPRLVARENAQPVYTLRGPSYPNGVSFNFRDSRPGAASVPPPAPSTYRVLPGAHMETGFNLTEIQALNAPGEYTLSARIDWEGWSAEAAPVKFRVEKAKFVEASLGMDVYSRSARSLRAVWIGESSGRRFLGESFFYENRPDLGEMKLSETRIIRQIGPKGADPFCPWVNYDRMSAPKFWHGWREGAILYAFSDDEQAPRRFDMRSDKARIVHPALMSESGELDVLVLDGNRKTLRMVRFPAQPEGENSAAAAWTAELPEEVAGLRLGIGPKEQGGSRLAVAVSQHGAKLAIRIIRIRDNAAEISPPLLTDTGYVLHESRPAIGFAPDGSMLASVLFAKHPGLRTLAVADVAIPREGEPKVQVTALGLAPAPVVQAWTEFTATDDPPVRRWLIRTNNEHVLGGQPLVRVNFNAPVVDLLRMSVATYCLTLDPDHGARMVPTGF